MESFVEVCMNTFLGFGISFLTQLVIFHHLNINLTFATNLYIGFIFTVVSILRGYIIRRWFNNRIHKAALAITRAATTPTSSRGPG